MNFINFSVYFCIIGVTSSGKTKLSFEISKNNIFEFVNVDTTSFIINFSIGSGKPFYKDLILFSQHLINIDIVKSYFSFYYFLSDFNRVIIAIKKRHKIPILLGGSMMYFKLIESNFLL